MLNVQQALSIAPLVQAKIVAGANGLQRPIRNVTIMEVPDLIQWLKGNDFVITSLFCIKDDHGAQVRLVRDMARLGCAALAIKTSRYVRGLPAEMIATANELSFPLIDIPEHIAYIDIVNPLMERLLDHTAGVLRQGDMAFRWLQEVILSNQGLEAALFTLQKLIGRNLTLECPDLGLILTAPEDSGALSPLSTDTTRHLNCTCRPVFLMRKRDSADIPCLIIPIMGRSTVYAFLTVENYQQDQGLSPTDQAILDHGTPLMGMELMRLHSRAELERQQINSFVEELIAQDYKSDKAMLERARYLGLNLAHESLIMIFDVDEFWSSMQHERMIEEEVQVLKSQLQRDLTHYLKDKSSAPFVVALRSDSLVILTSWAPGQSRDGIVSTACKLAQDILLHLKRAFPSLRFTGGVGLPQQGLNDLVQSFLQAWKAIALGRQAYGRGRVYCYDKLGVYRLLCSHPDTEELIALRDEILGPLVDYDQKQKTNLIETLATYFFHNENISATAKALFLHHNTVRYRLERAASLLSLDLNSTEHRFQIYLALRIAALHPFNNREEGQP